MKQRKHLWVSGGLVLALLAAGGAYATIPSSDGSIHGCYAKSGGALTVVDASVTGCKSGETSLNWNAAGAPVPRRPSEFVEIVNSGADPVDLAGYRLVYRPSGGVVEPLIATLSGTLNPGDFYLVASTAFASGTPVEQRIFSGLFANTSGGLGLRDAAGAMVDSVG